MTQDLIGALTEFVGADDDDDDFLGIMGGDEDEDLEDVIGAVAKGKRKKALRALRHGVSAATYTGTRGRRVVFGGQAVIAAGATAAITITMQEALRPDKLVISGRDNVANTAIPRELIEVNDIRVGNKPQMPAVGVMTATLFAPDAYTGGQPIEWDTIQPGTALVVQLTSRNPVNAGTFTVEGTGRALR
jgi:hypothetical protein